jgi:translation initiation factor 1
MKKKIPLATKSEPLQTPFAALDASGFPNPPEAPAPKPRDNLVRPAARGRVVLRRERQHRGGKTVVVAGPFPEGTSRSDLAELCKDARKALGCGGTVHQREMEIQGDQPERLADFLRRKGFLVAGCGA